MDKAANQHQGQQDWLDLSFYSHEGLRLYARHYRAHAKATTRAAQLALNLPPLLCLSSFTGNSAEFDTLARDLSQSETPRDVYCLDYRGRGRSQRDRQAGNYNSYVELRDILDFLTIYNLHNFHVLGSSRGGINAMLLAAARPGAIKAMILNDLGPVLEPAGVARLTGQLANMPVPYSWQEAAGIMQAMYESRFPALQNEDWQALASCWFRQDGRGHFIPSYDPRLAISGRYINHKKTLPAMWRQFLVLNLYPLLIIRGENSDMLSIRTVDHMRTLHWRSKVVTVPGQGHAPLLRDRPSLSTISAFLQQHDQI